MNLVMATAAVQLVYSHITKNPGICGGRACIDGTRVRVLDVAVLAEAGQTPAQIQGAYPSLNLAQVHAALSYAYEYPQEIQAQLEEDRRFAERIVRDRALTR